MLVRRMLLLIAVLMAITAVTVAVAPQREASDPATTVGTTPGATPAAPAGTSPEGSPRARDDELADAPVETMDARRRGQVVRVAAGDRVRLRVVSSVLESVQLGTDGPIEVVDVDSPAEFEVLAEADLDAQVRLLESDRTIGRLVAQP